MTAAVPAEQVVASFDSASVLHAALGASLRGEPFPHLGNSALAGFGIRLGGRLPWPLLRTLYARIGASEGVDPHRLGNVDMASVARWLVDGLPRRRYPAAMVGATNGALAHLAAALQIPWLPGTVLLPVARRGDPQRPIDALRFGERYGPPLLDANPDIALHHMHDQIQDELMVARMTYFRVKWRQLPSAYGSFLAGSLSQGAPVLLVEDRSTWPVVRVSERAVFQPGAQGGVEPDEYLRRRHTPQPDDEAPEAEWGAEPGLALSLERWCTDNDHPLIRISYRGPQAPAHAVASTMRSWYADRGEPADRLLVSSFVVGDPWRTINAAAVPFWTFFSVEAALQAFEEHLAGSGRYSHIDVLMFQHGVRSAGSVSAERWLAAARRFGATARLIGVNPRRSPHDIGSFGRYGAELARLPTAERAWTPMSVRFALDRLAAAGVKVVSG